MRGGLPRGRDPYPYARRYGRSIKQDTICDKIRYAENRDGKARRGSFIRYGALVASASAATAVIVVVASTATAVVVIRRKQDDDDNEDQKTVVAETTAKIHEMSSFPGVVKAVGRG